MIQFILLGIAVTVLLTWLIVKFVPVKFIPVFSFILLGVAGYISFLIYEGIMEPIKFHEIKRDRYAVIVKNLKMIRDAEDAYNTVHGKFCKDEAELIKFIETGKIPVVDTKTIVVNETRGAIVVEVEKKVTDTIGYKTVKDKLFINRNYKNMMMNPFNNKKFVLETSTIKRSNNTLSNTFMVSVDKSDILVGLSPSLIKSEKESLGGDNIPGTAITIGSLDEVTTGGNWPAIFDILSDKK